VGPIAAQVRRRGDVAVALAVMALSTAMTIGWFATGNASAPDAGLQQIDLLMLDEPVLGVEAVGGRPTMLVVTGQRCPPQDPEPRRLDDRFGLVVSPDAALARRLALSKAAEGCSPGYVLLDGDSRIRYRTYDPGWPRHDQEQEILLEAIAKGSRG
jgi:hypothetical protein